MDAAPRSGRGRATCPGDFAVPGAVQFFSGLAALGGGGGKGGKGGRQQGLAWTRRTSRTERAAALGLRCAAAGLLLGGLWAWRRAGGALIDVGPGARFQVDGPGRLVLTEGDDGRRWDSLDRHERVTWWVGKTDFEVPHQMFFTYKYNMLEKRTPPLLFRNVLRTIEAYRDFWGEPTAPVHFLDDTACRDVISRVEDQLAFGHADGIADPDCPLARGMRLADHFDAETEGMYKADLCRVAALYESGGYYFDVDIEAIEAVAVPPGVGLVTSMEYGAARLSNGRVFTPGVFQAFIAVAPKHPVLREALRLMYKHYQGSYDYMKTYHGSMTGLMGTKIFKDALDPYVLANQANVVEGKHELVKLLKEDRLTAYTKKFADVAAQRRNTVPESTLCDFFVYDPYDGRAKFFSRIVGANEHCCPTQEHPDFQLAPEGCIELAEAAREQSLEEPSRATAFRSKAGERVAGSLTGRDVHKGA